MSLASGASVSARGGRGYGVTIAATGHAYPSLVVDNHDFVRRAAFSLSTDPTGLAAEMRLKTRRWCAEGETTWTMARDAARSALDKVPELKGSIDLVLVASGTTMAVLHPPEPESPGMADLAPLLIEDLGLEGALGIDIKACYCTGFLRCIEIADGLLADPNRRAALIVASEQGSRLATAATNRSSFCFLMADAAGAAVLRKGALVASSGVIDYVNFTEADKRSWIAVGDDGLSMVVRGSRAGEATLSLLVRAGKTLLTRNAMTPSDVTWLLPIQTHAGIVDSAANALGFSADRVLWTGDVTGFSGSASIPACLSEQIESGKVRPGDRVLSIAVGAGMSCGAALLSV